MGEKLFQHASRVDRDGEACHVAGFIRGQEQHGIADVDRLDPADRQHVHQLCDHGHIVGTRVLQVWPEQPHRALVHEHGCVDVGRTYRVDANEVLPQLDSEGPHQSDHAVLGCDVVTGVRVRLQSAYRAGEHDRAALTAGDQMWHSGLHGFPDSGEVDTDHVVPVMLGGLVQRLAAVANAGVGDDDVQPAQLLDTVVHGFLEGVEVTDVDLGGDDPAIEAFDQIRSLRQVVRGGRCNLRVRGDRAADVDRDDVGPLSGESHCVAATLSACCAGDEGDLARYSSCHDPPHSG